MNVQTAPSRSGRKLTQVLEGAREIFMRDGFEGASVDEIAKASGVSKATLYNYFPDKRVLFLEVAKSECCRQGTAADDMLAMSAPPEQALLTAASRMVRLFTSRLGCNIFRVCVAESERFPELGQEFWRSGPEQMRATLVAYLNGAIDRGELDVDDCDFAAAQFCELCKTDLVPKVVLGLQPSVSDEEIHKVAQGAVDMFMARYGAR